MNPQKKKLGKFVHLNPKLKIGGANALIFPIIFTKRVKIDDGEVSEVRGEEGRWRIKVMRSRSSLYQDDLPTIKFNPPFYIPSLSIQMPPPPDDFEIH